MKFLQTPHQRKSTLITSVILVILLFVMYHFGLRYLDPPEEYGVAINFGDSNVGQGLPVPQTKKLAPKQEQVVEEVVKEEVVEEPVQEQPKQTIKEEVITNETAEEVPVVEKQKETPKPVEETPKKEEPKSKPKPSKEATEALQNLLKGNTSDGNPKGEGDDQVAGTKGSQEGDAESTKFYGKEGSGEDGNYNLAGRRPLTKPIEKPDCQEEGRVVVRIEVDRSGKVIAAEPGVKGSTNTAPCLLKPAKAAALKTRWNPDPDAAERQFGTIIYQFTLTQ